MWLSYSDNSTPPAADVSDWPHRVLLAAIALGGTLAYAASFQVVPHAARSVGFDIAHAGACVGIAAGLAWPAFGGVLLLVTGARPSALDWADACLRTMCSGVVVLAVAAAVNLDLRLLGVGTAARPWLATLHAALLVLGNAVMYGVFAGEARRLGLAPPAALALWMLALNGTFATTLLFLYRNGVM